MLHSLHAQILFRCFYSFIVHINNTVDNNVSICLAYSLGIYCDAGKYIGILGLVCYLNK